MRRLHRESRVQPRWQEDPTNRLGSRPCRCSWRGRDRRRVKAAALERLRCWCQSLSLVTANQCRRSWVRRGLPLSRPESSRGLAKLFRAGFLTEPRVQLQASSAEVARQIHRSEVRRRRRFDSASPFQQVDALVIDDGVGIAATVSGWSVHINKDSGNELSRAGRKGTSTNRASVVGLSLVSVTSSCTALKVCKLPGQLRTSQSCARPALNMEPQSAGL